MRKGKAIEVILAIRLNILGLKAAKLGAEVKAMEAKNQDRLSQGLSQAYSEVIFFQAAKDYELLIEIAEGMVEYMRVEGNLPKNAIVCGESLSGGPTK